MVGWMDVQLFELGGKQMGWMDWWDGKRTYRASTDQTNELSKVNETDGKHSQESFGMEVGGGFIVATPGGSVCCRLGRGDVVRFGRGHCLDGLIFFVRHGDDFC